VEAAKDIKKSFLAEIAAGNDLADWSPQAKEPGFMEKVIRVLDSMQGYEPEQNEEPEGKRGNLTRVLDELEGSGEEEAEGTRSGTPGAPRGKNTGRQGAP
jgi:hypothetical protein